MNPWTIPNSAGLPSRLRSPGGAWMRPAASSDRLTGWGRLNVASGEEGHFHPL